MNIKNGFDLLIDVLFSINPQFGGGGPKAQDPFILFYLGEG